LAFNLPQATNDEKLTVVAVVVRFEIRLNAESAETGGRMPAVALTAYART